MSASSSLFAKFVSSVEFVGATTFSVYHGDISYSLIISRIKLVKILPTA